MYLRFVSLLSLLVAPSLGLCDPAQDQEKPRDPKENRRHWWGLDVGAFFPTDGDIRDRFGGSMLRIGLRPFDPKSGNWRFVTDVTILSGRRGDNRLLAVPLTFGFLKSFGNEDDETRTFVMIGAGPVYYDYAIERLTNGGTTVTRIKERTFGTAAHVDAGIVFGNRFSITGRYDWMSRSRGFDFSGFSLTFSFALFRI